MSQHEEHLTTASRSHPCRVCGGDHKCSRGDSGLIVCGRAKGDVAGFVHLGASPKDPQWNLYRAADDPELRRNAEPVRARRGPDWESLAAEHANRITSDGRNKLAKSLGLPAAVLNTLAGLGVGSDDGGPFWTFPERDGAGRIVGISRRYATGAKKAMPHGRRGLTVVTGWREKVGPVFVPEGASDTLALTAAGLSAVGRPTNTGGVDMLAVLLADWPADRGIVVLGENDRKADGKWPGREGVEAVAPKLAEKLDRPVHTAFPPDGAKDVRAWLTEHARAA